MSPLLRGIGSWRGSGRTRCPLIAFANGLMKHLSHCLRAFAVLGMLLSAVPLAAAEQAWNFEALDRQAQALAKREYRPSPPLPTALQDLDYDDYRLIAFEHERAIWKADQRPFWLECFHRGYLYRDKVS